MSTTEKILEACKYSKGMTRAELVDILQRKRSIVGNTLDFLTGNGRIYKAGVNRHYRYFTKKSDADAWYLVAMDKYLEIRKMNKAKKLQNRASSTREKRRIARTAKTSELIIRKEYAPQPVKSVTVVWPDHVKVQVAPTPKDTRFSFEPTPGWRGVITNDWMARRLSNVNPV